MHILLDKKGLDEMGINPAFLCLHDLKEELVEGFNLIWQHTSNQSMASSKELSSSPTFFLLPSTDCGRNAANIPYNCRMSYVTNFLVQQHMLRI